MKPVKTIKIKPIKMHFNLDTDKDKVPDWKDCRPFNPFKQHVRPSKTTKKRLEKLPIYFVSHEATPYQLALGRKFYTTQDKKVPKSVQQTRQRFYSAIKKRPDALGEIERAKPHSIVFTKRGVERHSKTGKKSSELGYAKTLIDFDTDEEKEVAVVRASTGGRGQKYTQSDIEDVAGTIHHELEHVKQKRRWKDKPKLQKKMAKGRYEKRREEVLAREAEEKAQMKRYNYMSMPYEFSPLYEEKKEDWEAYAKEYPDEDKYYKRKQKKFFEGYQKMMEDIE